MSATTNDTTSAKAERGKVHRAENEAAIKQFGADLGAWIRTDRDALIAENAQLRAERDAARATVREWIAANGPGGWIDDLRKAAPAPVPAADVPAFLLSRVS